MYGAQGIIENNDASTNNKIMPDQNICLNCNKRIDSIFAKKSYDNLNASSTNDNNLN